MPIRKLTLLLVAVICLPIFAHLDELPMQLWDEGRVSANTLEMLQTHNWLVPTYEFQPDMWSTKPPFFLWVQALFYKVFGISLLAARLPSAFAALFTCLFIFWFFTKKIKQPIIGFIACLVLVCSQGYIALHGARTADYDALLTMLTTMYCIFYYLYIEEENRKYLAGFFICLIFAALTKGVAGILFTPALVIYTIARKKLTAVFRSPTFYFGLVAFVVFVPGYYLLRDHYNPGYLQVVYDNELGGRFSTVIEGHNGGALYYLDCLTSDQYKEWWLLCLFGVIAGLFSKDASLRKITIYLASALLGFLLVISLASTKLSWYDIPLYPVMAMLVALFIYTIYKILGDLIPWQKYLSANIFPYVFLFAVFIMPYSSIISRVMSPATDKHLNSEASNDMAEVLTDIMKRERDIRHMKFAWHGYAANVYWYSQAFRITNRDILQADEKNLQPGDTLAAYQDEIKKYVDEHYQSTLLQSYKAVSIYKIIAPKRSNPEISAR